MLAQGETTSAIVGAVTDPSGAAIAGATVTIIGTETGSRRGVKTDDAGRFNFPQLKLVRIQSAWRLKASTEINKSVSAGLGQRQMVAFVLQVAAAKGEVTVTGRAPLAESRIQTHRRH